MTWLFLICAAIVAAYLGRWIAREREAIRVYRDRVAAARDAVARERPPE